jgi:hypothetical protein
MVSNCLEDCVQVDIVIEVEQPLISLMWPRDSRAGDSAGSSDAQWLASGAAAETLLPAMLWECLHMQCSQAVVDRLLQCPAERQLWSTNSKPACIADTLLDVDYSIQRSHENGPIPPLPSDTRILWIVVIAQSALLGAVLLAGQCRSWRLISKVAKLQNELADAALALQQPLQSSGMLLVECLNTSSKRTSWHELLCAH